MRIAFDAKRLFHNHSGLGNYSRNLVSSIRNEIAAAHLYLFADHVKDSIFFDHFQKGFDIVSGNGQLFWRQFGMTKDLHELQPAIYHGLSNELPFYTNRLKQTKTIVTIHDLLFLKFPKYYPFFDRVIYKEKFRRACIRADHIIAVSQATKTDIVQFYKVPEDKITVEYPQCNPAYFDNYRDDAELEGYGLFVSAISERKNLEVVIQAVSMLPKSMRPRIKVVGSGPSRYVHLLKRQVENYGLEVNFEFLGQVDDIQLLELYRKASFSIYPSHGEGFGIPIVESLLSGTPVITSNKSSMPEAAGDFGVLVDTANAKHVMQAIKKMIANPTKLPLEDVIKIRKRFNIRSQSKRIFSLYQDVAFN